VTDKQESDNKEEENKPDIDLGALSDEEILNLDPETLVATEEGSEENAGDSEKSGSSDQSADSESEDDNDSGVTDGADSEDDSSEGDDGAAGSTNADKDEDPGTGEETEGEQSKSDEDDQSSSNDDSESGESSKPSEKTDFEALYNEVMTPFTAAKRKITVNNPDEARRLMQMGVDYSRKMEAMKPFQRILKSLEKNDLLNQDKVNFIIDLVANKDPEAIKKFLKDNDIDPVDLSTEGDSDYKPTDHSVGDREIDLDDVLGDIRGTGTFERTIDVITNQWDTESRKLLLDNPDVIRILNGHVESGVFDQIDTRLVNERLFGKHKGLPDLVAYKAVGEAIQAENGFKPKSGSESSPAGGDAQNSAQDQGADAAAKAEKKHKDQKRAASPTEGNAADAGKKKVDYMGMSDEEILKVGAPK